VGAALIGLISKPLKLVHQLDAFVAGLHFLELPREPNQ